MKVHNQELISFSKNRYSLNNKQIEKSLRQLSTGVKIATSSDNASGLSISETMRAQIRGISQAQSNMQDGLSLLESANEGLNNVNSLLQRARELSVSAATDTMVDEDRAAVQTEIAQILEAIDDTASKLEFNTRQILGENTTLKLQVGANPGQTININLIDTSAAALGVDQISVLTSDGANDAIAALDDAINQTSLHLTKVGSYIESIEFHLFNAYDFENNLSQSLSILEDVDIAEEMMNFTKLDIRQYGDQLLISQVNKNSQGVLGIL